MQKALPLLFVFMLLATAACKKEDTNPKTIPGKTYKVTYTIGCTDCQVIYVSDTAGTQTTEHHQNSSWSYSFNARYGQEVLLLAYNTASSHQSVKATIQLNDSVLVSRTTYCPVNGLSFCVDTVR